MTLQEGARSEAFLAAAIRGDAAAWRDLTGRSAASVVALSENHGVLPLIADRAQAHLGIRHPITEALHARARGHAIADLIREAELRVLVAELHAAGVPPLLIKGAHLAYGLYARPDLRPRSDTDLLVSREVRETADHVLRRIGYVTVGQLEGDLVMYQAPYVKRRDDVPVHRVDLHWRIANPQMFGGVLDYDAVLEASVTIPSLDARALGLAPVHALVLACVHQVAHHNHAPMLIWDYDVYLLGTSLTPAEWNSFTDFANDRGVGVIARRTLERAERHFGVVAPVHVYERLETGSAREQAMTRYLAENRRHIHELVWDLQALPSWSQRWKLMRQHLIPGASYMREVYAPANPAPLPWLYAQRACRGAWRWLLKPPGRGHDLPR